MEDPPEFFCNTINSENMGKAGFAFGSVCYYAGQSSEGSSSDPGIQRKEFFIISNNCNLEVAGY